MARKLKPLAEQVIVITGASSGIGRVTAKAAAARGAKVLLIARNEASLGEVVAEIVAAGGTAAYKVADVGRAEEVEDAARDAVARFGRIDTWVNNAGTAIYAKLVDTPLKEHKRLFRTNYFGVVNGAMAAIPYLREHGGALITIGSIASDLPSPILSAYSASKHAVKGYVDALRMELIADKVPIVVTLIKPAGIDTPIAQHAANHVDGEAMLPQPVYDPAIVARAILDAAEHPRRDVTVGGAGRLQVMFGTHFPALMDRVAGMMIPMIVDPKRSKTKRQSLFAPDQPGAERSGVQAGRRVSVYTAAARHPLAIGLGVAATAAAVGWLASRPRPDRDAGADEAAEAESLAHPS